MSSDTNDNAAYLKAVTKIRFEFLRLVPVDVLRYLPPFLAKDAHFKGVQDALSREHENYRLLLQDIAAQFFVDTATWGLTSWERIYETDPPTGADYATRRALLKAKIQGQGVMTVEAMRSLVMLVSGADAVEITELPSDGLIRFTLDADTTRKSILLRTLETMMPAHLVWELYFRVVFDDGADKWEGEEDLSLRMQTSMADLYPWSDRRYDGKTFYTGPLIYDGSAAYDGASTYGGEAGELRLYDAATPDTLSALSLSLALGDKEDTVDAGGALAVTRGFCYDGSITYDGARLYDYEERTEAL